MSDFQPGPRFDLLTTLFCDPTMSSTWSETAAVEGWLRVEAELARAQADAGLLSIEDAEQIATACQEGSYDRAALWRNARNVGYPILPLVRQIAAALPDGPNGRVHYGATIPDIMDTTLACQLSQSCKRYIELVLQLGDALHDQVVRHAATVMAARTHAQQAVPTTFGAKLAVFLEQVRRDLERVVAVCGEVAVVSLFGAGGTSAALGDKSALVRQALGRRLGLRDVTVPWHVARDGIVRFGQTAAGISGVCARVAREVIELSRSELGEVSEPNGRHRGASSTMPQKANPIFSESIIGLSVNAQGLAATLLRAMEAVHERAAGEWQVEWFALPSVAILSATALGLTVELVSTLQVNPDAVHRNLYASLDLMSEAAMMRLAAPLGREQAHDIVYDAAMRARVTGRTAVDVLRETLTPELLTIVGSLEPEGYLGEASRICAAACESWASTRASVVSAMEGRAT